MRLSYCAWYVSKEFNYHKHTSLASFAGSIAKSPIASDSRCPLDSKTEMILAHTSPWRSFTTLCVSLPRKCFARELIVTSNFPPCRCPYASSTSTIHEGHLNTDKCTKALDKLVLRPVQRRVTLWGYRDYQLFGQDKHLWIFLTSRFTFILVKHSRGQIFCNFQWSE